MSLKNLWSLNIDELLVADQLKSRFSKKQYEVFFPLNAQMKDIDLLLVELNKNKVVTIQVKGSRTFEPQAKEVEKYGEGSASWYKLSRKSILEPSNSITAYVFVVHSFTETERKKDIVVDYLVIPYKDFVDMLSRKKSDLKNEFYHFYFWVDPKGKRAFDCRSIQDNGTIDLTKYLNSWEILI